MRFSLNWLNEYVDLSGIDLKELIDTINMRIATVSKYETLGSLDSSCIVGRVYEVLQEEGDSKILSVDIGSQKCVCVINADCSIQKGYKYVFKYCNTSDHIEICSVHDLGIALDDPLPVPQKYHVGECALSVSEFQDIIISINPSIRSDLLGHYGLARELSIIFDKPLQEIEVDNILIDKVLCSGWNALKSIVVSAFNTYDLMLPADILLKLYFCGISSKNKSDVYALGEYVMLELGAPLAIASVDRNSWEQLCIVEDSHNKGYIKQGNIPLTKLGVEYYLNDGKQTDELLVVYSAFFHPNEVRAYSSATMQSSLQAERNCRYCSLEYSVYAIARFYKLLRCFALNTEIIHSRIEAQRFDDEARETFFISRQMIARLVGDDRLWNQATNVFEGLGMLHATKDDELELSVPIWRNKIDLNHLVSFVRELIRIKGDLNCSCANQHTDRYSTSYCQSPGEHLRKFLINECTLDERYFRTLIIDSGDELCANNKNVYDFAALLEEVACKQSLLAFFGVRKIVFVTEEHIQEGAFLFILSPGELISRSYLIIAEIEKILNSRITIHNTDPDILTLRQTSNTIGWIKLNPKFTLMCVDVSAWF